MRPWSPAIYRKAGNEANIPDASIKRGISQALPPQHKNLPAILNLAHLAKMSGTNRHILAEIVKRRSDPYRLFPIRKRSGGKRWIYTPVGDLRIVQSWLHKHVLLSNMPSGYSYAYWPKKSIVGAAEVHTGCSWLIKIDVEQFFESISEIQVYHVLRDMRYPALISFQIARLCTRVLPVGRTNARSKYGMLLYSRKYWKSNSRGASNSYKHYQDKLHRIGALPQGVPTSPLLAELAMQALDEKLAVLSGEHGLSYTRYADDLGFSTISNDFSKQRASLFVKEVYGALRQHGLWPNHTKTVVIPPGARKIVLGLLVDTDRPRLTKQFRDTVRQHLYYAGQFGPQAHSEAKAFNSVIGFRNHLCGLINYAMSVDSEWASARMNEFDNLDWPL